MNTQFEFTSSRLTSYMDKIGKESRSLIEELVVKYSPIQIAEDIESIISGELQILRVIKITLFGIDSWDALGEKLSFSYEGMPLTKKGNPMKNRKPIWFSAFRKEGKKYHMPSYNRIEIKTARMYR